MSLINLLLEHVYYSNYCSNLVSNHSLIRLIRFVSQFTSKLYNLFLFHLNLILHTYKIFFRYDRFGILNFATKQDNVLVSFLSWQRSSSLLSAKDRASSTRSWATRSAPVWTRRPQRGHVVDSRLPNNDALYTTTRLESEAKPWRPIRAHQHSIRIVGSMMIDG